MAASLAAAQVNIQGTVKTVGAPKVFGQSGAHQYTHIWAFAPPNGTDGANDNANFKLHVMSSSNIDGVSLLEAWNSIEKNPPDSNACIPSDVCQPDPVAPQMYHHYDWGTYDNTAGGSTGTTPVYQWLLLSGNKKINLLITGAASGPTNPETPHYVTSSLWYNLFNPQTQDVINGLKDCAAPPWGGLVPSGGATYSSGPPTVTVTDTNCCSAASQASSVQDQDLVWVTASPSGCGTGRAGATASVGSGVTDHFSYSPSGTCSSPTNVTYISAAQSWPVPYEYPYKNALKAYWAAVVAHYGPGFSLPAVGGMNYFSHLNYFRFGGSVGSEWYPYCLSGTNGGVNVGLENLSSPYIYVKTGTDADHVGWLDYYKEMGNYLQSLGPPFKIVHSINAAETPPDDSYGTSEAGYAAGWSNRFGVRDGFGSQGLSVQDYLNCTNHPPCEGPTYYSASNWYPLFQTYNTRGVPLELQPIALSYPKDYTCTNGCSVTTYSGDLTTFLYPFATSVGGTDFEIYWRDLSLAYDVNNYCTLNTSFPPTLYTACVATSATTGGQINPPSLQNTFFQAVGQGDDPADCGSNMPQGHSTGNCAYATNINSAHGQH